MPHQVSDLKTRTDYQSARANLFPSSTSLDWYIRRHRQRLSAGGALSIICGRQLIVEARFDELVLEIGQEIAERVGASQ